MQCSVVIPCHNGADLTRECVQSLLEQDGTKPDEILLVDNASSEDLGSLARLHPSVRVLRQTSNLGFGAGTNAGIRASRGERVLVLNNDTRAAANLLHELTRVLEASPTIGAAAPVSNHVKGPARLPVGALGSDTAGREEIAVALRTSAVATQDVDSLAGLCLLLRRPTLDRVGWFDERFGHGNFEDDDLSLRLRLHGYRLVIARRAFLHHEGHATFRALGLDLPAEIERRRGQFIDKWQPDPAGRATIAAMHSDLRGAATEAAAARRVWPLWPDADWHLARWHAGNGDHASAVHHLRHLLRSCPQHSDAALALAQALLSLGDVDAAAAQLLHTAHAFHLEATQLARVLGELGQLDFRRERLAGAGGHFLAAAELRPEDGSLRNWAGVCQLATGDLDAAQQSFRRAAAAGFPLAHTNLGICLHRMGRDDEARHSFERAVALLPDDATAHRNLAAAAGAGMAGPVSSRGS